MSHNQPSGIAVLGAGAWGTALAVLLARNGNRTVLWGRNADHMNTMDRERRNPWRLPDTPFPEGLEITASLSDAVAGSRDILLAVPSGAFRALLGQLAQYLGPPRRLAWATKGVEVPSHKLMHQIAGEVVGGDVPMAALSGPTFAREVAAGLPTAITAAATDAALAEALAERLHNEAFRVYTSDDLVGVQLGGATKNVLAIAAGSCDGLGFGANARAALITRGLAEMMRLGEAMGSQRETFVGLAGLGDLVLTCTDDQSRNRRMGLRLARGESVAEAEAAIGEVVEGVKTAHAIYELARAASVDMPITEHTYRVLYEGLSVRDAVHSLLTREQKPERG